MQFGQKYGISMSRESELQKYKTIGGYHMCFFDFKQVVFLIISFLVLPLSCNVFFYFKNPKKVWFAPIVIIFLGTIVFVIHFSHNMYDLILSEEVILSDTNCVDIFVAFWMFIYAPMQIISAFSFTAVTRLIIWIKERDTQRLT